MFMYSFKWHYLSNATCPIRPGLFYASFIQCMFLML